MDNEYIRFKRIILGFGPPIANIVEGDKTKILKNHKFKKVGVEPKTYTNTVIYHHPDGHVAHLSHSKESGKESKWFILSVKKQGKHIFRDGKTSKELNGHLNHFLKKKD